MPYELFIDTYKCWGKTSKVSETSEVCESNPPVAHAMRFPYEDRLGLRHDVFAIGLLALLTAVFFWRLLFTAGVWMPAGGGDLAGFLYPTYHFAAESLKQGHIPLWNPHLYAGAPHVADIQSGVFYPINLLAFLLTGEVTYRLMEMLSVFHFFLAGTSMYLCLRLLRPTTNSQRSTANIDRSSFLVDPLTRPACLTGAVAFMFSGLFITHFGNLNLIAVAAWLPLVFLGTYRALNQRRVGWALFGGLFLAMAALAGHAQPLQFIILLVSLYTLYHLLIHRREGRRWTMQTVGLAGLIGIVGLGLAALGLVPALEMIGYTRRASLSYAEAAQYSLPPQALVGLLVPDFFGRGVAGFWAPWPRVEVGYLGVLPLLLAAVGVTQHRREPLVPFLAGLALLSLLLALGANTPLHRWAYEFVPGFQNLRVPARFIYLMDFALAGLAALGLDALLKQKPDEMRDVARAIPWATLLLVIAVAATGYLFLNRYRPAPERSEAALRGLVVFGALLLSGVILIVARARDRLNVTLFGGLCVAVVALDLIGLGSGVDVGRQDPTANFHRPRVVEFLRGDPSLYRIEVRPEVWGWWSPDAALIHGFQDAGGIYNPLRLSDYQLYWESLTDRATRLYDFLNVKYLIAPPNFGLPWDKFAPVLDDGELTVYLNQEALPRVQMIYNAQVVDDQTAAFHAVHADGFDPAQTVVLEADQTVDHLILRQAQGVVSRPTTPPRLAFAGYDLNNVAVDVTTEVPGYLVLSDVWYPGWHAQIDGAAAPVLRANYAFRAVPVLAGNHRVELHFAPLTWKIGLAISVIVFIGTALAAGWLLRRHVGWRPQVESGTVGQLAIALLVLTPLALLAADSGHQPAAVVAPLRPISDETPWPVPAVGPIRPKPKVPARPTAEPRQTTLYLPFSMISKQHTEIRIPLMMYPDRPDSEPDGIYPLPPSSPHSLTPSVCSPDLVVRQGDQLVLDGRPYTFVGTNISYLAKSTFPESEMGPTIQALAGKGVDVIRVWVETGADLDRVAHMLDLGQKYGMRFIITLEDYYFDKSESWFDSTYHMQYLPHVRQVVARFRNHPAVMMWELMNEPNCSPEGQRPSCLNALYKWARETTTAIRKLDPCRPISLGTIWIGGYNVAEETQFERLHRIPGVDIISVHRPTDAWHPREIALAEKLNMPIFFGEVHHQALDEGCRPLPGKIEGRAQAIKEDLRRAAEAGVDGYLLWQFAHEPLKDENGGPLYYCGKLDYFLDDPAWDVLRNSTLKSNVGP